METPSISLITDPSEIDNVVALAHEIWNQHFVPIAGKEQVDYMLEKFQSASAITSQISSGYRYYKIVVDDQIVGYFALAPIPEGSTEAQLSKIYVREDHQGRGLGRTMLAFIEELCVGMGVRKLWLTVYRNNARTIAIYEHMGFTHAGEIVQDIGNGFVMDDYRMEKLL